MCVCVCVCVMCVCVCGLGGKPEGDDNIWSGVQRSSINYARSGGMVLGCMCCVMSVCYVVSVPIYMRYVYCVVSVCYVVSAPLCVMCVVWCPCIIFDCCVVCVCM